MSWITIATMIFTIGSIYGGLALMLSMVLFHYHRDKE